MNKELCTLCSSFNASYFHLRKGSVIRTISEKSVWETGTKALYHIESVGFTLKNTNALTCLPLCHQSYLLVNARTFKLTSRHGLCNLNNM